MAQWKYFFEIFFHRHRPGVNDSSSLQGVPLTGLYRDVEWYLSNRNEGSARRYSFIISPGTNRLETEN